jgi:hypothetical protein
VGIGGSGASGAAGVGGSAGLSPVDGGVSTGFGAVSLADVDETDKPLCSAIMSPSPVSRSFPFTASTFSYRLTARFHGLFIALHVAFEAPLKINKQSLSFSVYQYQFTHYRYIAG